MITPTIISLPFYKNFPEDEIGTHCFLLGQYYQHGLPLAENYCLPQSTLKRIATCNDLKQKIKSFIKKYDLDKSQDQDRLVAKVKKTISQQHIPENIAKTLLNFYQENLNQQFFSVKASCTQDYQDEYAVTHNSVKGESNLIDSILKIWSEKMDLHKIIKQKFFPCAISVQVQYQTSKSGLALSFNPSTNKKNEVFILGTPGCLKPNLAEEAIQNITDNNYLDYFLVSLADWSIIDQKIKTKKISYQRKIDGFTKNKIKPKKARQSTFDHSELQSIAHLVHKVKLKSLNQIKIYFSKLNHKYIIDYIEEVDEQQIYQIESLHTQKDEVVDILSDNDFIKDKKPFLIGKSLHGGIISGECRVIEDKTDVKNFKNNEIAVISNATQEHIPLIKKASAFVIDRQIKSYTFLNYIQKKQIPTIINTRFASKRLKNGLEIFMQANLGHIFLRHNQSQEEEKKSQQKFSRRNNRTPILTHIDQAGQVDTSLLNESDGISYITSESLFINIGKHPHQIIKSKDESLALSTFLDKFDFYHKFNHTGPIALRSIDFTSEDYKKLNYKSSLEPQEDNPMLGYRGGLRHVSDFTTLDFEFKIIDEIKNYMNVEVPLLLPFIRNTKELDLILKHIEYLEKDRQRALPYQIWFECDTPENLINISDYLQRRITGVLINCSYLDNLLQGRDANNETIQPYYEFDSQTIIKLLNSALKDIRSSKINSRKKDRINVVLELPQVRRDIIEYIQRYQLSGISVKPIILPLANYQQKQFNT